MAEVTTIQVTTDLRDRLKELKKKEGRSYEGLLNHLLDMYDLENGGN